MNELKTLDVNAIQRCKDMRSLMQKYKEVHIDTEHFIHNGVYVRTCKLPAGVAMASALIKIPTTLIVSGHCHLFNGEEREELEGYQVFRCDAPRVGTWVAVEDTYITMIFATDKEDVHECEKEFTDEWEMLQTCRA